MDIKVFKRIEQKYMLTSKQAKQLITEMSDYIEKDEYFKSQINNIYFDNEKDELIQNCEGKPDFKTKVRLRSYGIPQSKNDKVFLEVKNKYKDTVGKRRIKITLNEYYDYIQNNKFNKDDQIMKEADYLFKHYNLKPSIYIGYERYSYKAIENEHFRITFDYNLRKRRTNLKLEDGNYGEKYFTDDTVIMEVKTLDSMPLWFTRILTNNKLYPTSFSKYGKIYAKEQINKIERNEGGIQYA